MIITDYGVPLMIGGKYMTFPVMMYQDVIGMLDFGKGSVIGMLLLVPALIACILDMANRDKGNASFVGKPYKVKRNKSRDRIAQWICSLIIFLIFLPIGSFAILGFITKYPIDMTLSFKNIIQAVNMDAMKYLCNSIIIGNSNGGYKCIYYHKKKNKIQLCFALNVNYVPCDSRYCPWSFVCDVL